MEGAFGGERPAQSPLGGRDSDATQDEDLYFNMFPTHPIDVVLEELDNQQALRGGKRIKDKGKGKVNEKLKELVFIGSISLVDLDDIEVSEKNLMIDISESDDDVSSNPDSIGVRGGPRLCSQAIDSNVEPTSTLVALEIGEHPEPYTTPTASIDDPLFNAANKALHPDVVVVKQEADWFQLWEEKRKKKMVEKLATKVERERLAKDVEDARNEVACMKQLLEQQCGPNIQALLARSVQVLWPHPHASTPAPIVLGVPSPSFVFPHGICGSQLPPLLPGDPICSTSIPDILNYP